MEPQQHQLLLAIKGLPDGATATIGELAERLQLKHHSTVELVNRLEKHGYVVRELERTGPPPGDRPPDVFRRSGICGSFRWRITRNWK